ncbi:hypothetical protein ZOSMA_1G02960 [Zostera marina]|uniref:Uncharacterized protein n=1 Tax=Zostera marina TaxID=29655 RepID=A0A0K9PMW9_ZOSMR|nr:hypothetical protein ZOSMA_1G02960 [Zostera marina]
MLIISLSKVNDNLNNQQISERPTYVLINNFTHLIVSKRMGRSLCCETVHTNKGSWTKEEDQKLVAYIRVHGEGCWRSLPKAAGLLRCGKSCRLRWINYLRPDLKRGNFSVDEIEIIIKLHNLFGNKWSLIAGRLPGRTDNEIKNYWNTHIKRKLLSKGVDPSTHMPLDKKKHTTTTTTTTTTLPKKSYELSSVWQAQFASLAAGSSCFKSVDEELNLDLSISPPVKQQQKYPVKKEMHNEMSELCFSCRLGLRNSKECRCKNITVDDTKKNLIIGYNSSSSTLLHYRSRDMNA